jgi:hypothetical protein
MRDDVLKKKEERIFFLKLRNDDDWRQTLIAKTEYRKA